MKKILCKIVTIAMLVTMFSTVVNLCTASAAPNGPTQAVTKHHKHPSKPVKPPKTPKYATPTPTATETLVIEGGSVNSQTGKEVCVPIKLTCVPDNGIVSTDMSISYDTSILKYTGGSAGDIVPDPDANFAIAETSPGVLKLLFVDTTNLDKHICTDGVFAELNFKINISVSYQTSIKIYDITVGDGNYASVPTKAIDGYVYIAETTPHPSIPSMTTPPPTTPEPSSTPSTYTLRIGAGTLNAAENDNITLPINYMNVPANGISACNFTITYDPQQLEYISYEPGNIVPNPDVNFAINKAEDGCLKLLFLDHTIGNECINFDGIVANLNFKVVGHTSGLTFIDLCYATVADLNLNVIATELCSGSVTINSLVTPTPLSSFEITVGSKQASPNENVTLPIYFDDVPAIGISTCDFTITYDPKQLEFLSYEPGSIVPNPDTNFSLVKTSEGSLKLLFIDFTMENEFIKSGGIVANLNFKVIGSSYEVTHINISNQTVGDINLYSVPTAVYPGSVIIDIPAVQTPNPQSDFCCKVGSGDAKIGDTITIPVNFENVPDKGIAACNMTITYDSTQLEFVENEVGSIVKNPDMNFAINKLEDGTIKILFVDCTMKDEYITSNGLFTNLTFKVLPTKCGITSINVVNATFGDIDLNNLNTTIVPGVINVLGSTEIN
ncbi:cohesin domain-containing protein [Acetivibrio cellulolyticus]|uniref:cohesin domain-containing protein n=1 Tax=Acetivibrio cellulolyticus TaxID=35830 RepID=UPI0001E2C740|nr:cohesin domain-containing protein [Acetivibrio cellulolyticus]